LYSPNLKELRLTVPTPASTVLAGSVSSATLASAARSGALSAMVAIAQ
jgi:hypothetical protein